MSIVQQRGTAYLARMRSLCLLLTIGLLASCSVGNDFSRTTFQKKRYSRGYYVHKAKNRPGPEVESPQTEETTEALAGLDDTHPILLPPEGLSISPSSSLRPSDGEPVHSPPAASRAATEPAVEGTVEIFPPEPSVEAPIAADANAEETKKPRPHWTSIVSAIFALQVLLTLPSDATSALFFHGFAAMFAAASLAYCGRRRERPGGKFATAIFGSFAIPLVFTAAEGVPFAILLPWTGIVAALSALFWLLAKQFAPKPSPRPESPQTESPQTETSRRTIHWSTWTALAGSIIPLVLVEAVEWGTSGLTIMTLFFIANAILSIVSLTKTGPEKEHSGKALSILTLAWSVLATGFILFYLGLGLIEWEFTGFG